MKNYVFHNIIIITMLTRKPIPLNINHNKVNVNNLFEYTPYQVVDDEIIIDKEWFDNLNDWQRSMIEYRLNYQFTLGKVDVPHDISNWDKCEIIYYEYIDSFDYHAWWSRSIPNGPKGITYISIDSTLKQELIALYHSIDTLQNDSSALSKSLLSFKNDIEEFNNRYSNKKVFVRLSGTSGKNEIGVKSLDYDFISILKHLVSCNLFVKQEYQRDKCTYLIIMPWNDHIQDRYEFRIFVKNGVLVGASQQKWFENFQHTTEELDIIQKSLSSIKFIEHICKMYKDFIADVYVDIKDGETYLIEINPFGAHCGAGSSLFHWVDDYDLLYNRVNDNDCDRVNDRVHELRYLSAINF